MTPTQCAALVALIALFPPAAAHAQTETPAHEGVFTIFGEIASDFVHLPSRTTFIWVGSGGGAALAAHQLDDDLSSAPGAEWGRWSEFFDPGAYIGNGIVLAGAAAGTYAVGQWVGKPGMAHFGRDLLRAQVVTQVMVFSLKQVAQRERPDGSGTLAFPSGHAAATFASAVVLHRHIGGRWTVPLYAAASYVAVSRMHENKHYLSDVVFGSALGIATGLTVTRHIGTGGEWTIAPAAMRGGAAVLVTRMNR